MVLQILINPKVQNDMTHYPAITVKIVGVTEKRWANANDLEAYQKYRQYHRIILFHNHVYIIYGPLEADALPSKGQRQIL